MRKCLLPLFAALCVSLTAPAAEGDVPEWAKGVKITVPLTDPKIGSQIIVSDPDVWAFGADDNKKGYLQLEYDRKKYKSTYTPKHRSPVFLTCHFVPIVQPM